MNGISIWIFKQHFKQIYGQRQPEEILHIVNYIASSVMCSHAMDADFSFFELAVGSFVEAAVLMGKVVQC